MQSKTNWILIAILTLSLVLGISIAFRNQTALINFFSTDDAFYYFQSAKNFTEGKGISFDGIARGNGYHPLWMLVCIPVFTLARFDLWIPLRILVVIQAILHAGTGYFIYRLLIKKISPPLSLLTAAVWLFSPAIFNGSGSKGLETGINLFCITALLNFIATWSDQKKEDLSIKNYLLAGILASLTLLARLDNIYLLCFIGAWLVLKDSRLNRTWIFLDFFFSAFGAMFSYVAYVGITPTLYTLMPNIEIIILLSMVMLPLGQFLSGVYHLNHQAEKRGTALRIALGILPGGMLLIAAIMVIFPNGGFSRVALLIQLGIFLLSTLPVKLYFPMLNSPAQTNENAAPKINLKTVFTLDWHYLISNATSYFGPLFTTLGAFLLFNHFYFETSMPISGKIKAWWGFFTTPYGNRSYTLLPFLGMNVDGPWGILTRILHSFTELLQIEISSSLTLLAIIALLAGMLVLWALSSKNIQQKINHFALQPVMLGITFHACYYTMTGYVGYRNWYWIPEILLLLLICVLFLDTAFSGMLEKWPVLNNQSLGWIGSGITTLLLIANFISFNLTNFPFTPIEVPTALNNIRTLQQCTPEGSLIGMTGGGDVGYFIENRTIINMDGLINGTEYYEYLTNFRLHEYLDKINVAYVFGSETILFDSEPYMQSFTGRLVAIESTECVFDESFLLYEYLSD